MVHATDLELDVVSPSFDPALLLELPFGEANIDDLEYSWFTPPDSPRLESPDDIFTHAGDALPSEFTELLLAKGDDKHGLNWESILHGVPAPESAKKHAAPHHHLHTHSHAAHAQAHGHHQHKGTSSVMWGSADEDVLFKKEDGSALTAATAAAHSSHSSSASSTASWTPPPSPPLDDDIDFQAFVKAEFSHDGIILVDGLCSGATKRKQAEDALALQTKRAKLQLQRPKTAASLQTDTPEGKRHTHNVLERKRREDLKYSYQSLRMQVPDLSNAERAPTGQILNKAANFIAHLKAQEDELVQQLAVIRAENQRLRASIAKMSEEQEQSE